MKKAQSGEQKDFWDHIDILRRHFIFGVLLFVAIGSIIFIYGDQVISRLLLSPLKGEKLVFLSPLEPFLFKVKISLYTAILLSFPFWLGQVLHFVSPAFSSGKKIGLMVFAGASIIFAGLSIIITYLYFLPLTLEVLQRFTISGTESMFTANQYLSFCILQFLLVFIVFQIPMVITALSYGHIINPYTLSKHRFVSIMGIIISLAIITPTTDVITLCIVSAGAVVLWEIGIGVSKKVYNKALSDKRVE